MCSECSSVHDAYAILLNDRNFVGHVAKEKVEDIFSLVKGSRSFH